MFQWHAGVGIPMLCNLFTHRGLRITDHLTSVCFVFRKRLLMTMSIHHRYRYGLKAKDARWLVE